MNTKINKPAILTTPEAAAMLRMSEHQVRVLAEKKQIPAFRLHGKDGSHWRFYRREIEKLITPENIKGKTK